jgi:hypothetical protein
MEAKVRFPPIRPTTLILPGLGVSCDELGSADSVPLSRLVVVTELAEGTLTIPEVAGGRAGPVVTEVDSDEEEADKVTTGVWTCELHAPRYPRMLTTILFIHGHCLVWTYTTPALTKRGSAEGWVVRSERAEHRQLLARYCSKTCHSDFVHR